MNVSAAVDPPGDSIQLKAGRTGLVYLLTVLTASAPRASLATIVWQLVRGVDVAKWKEQNRALVG